jgi:chromosome segregation ATPase
MAFDFEQVKATLQRELNSLRQTGQELRVQANLARADLRDEYERLERQLHSAQNELDRVGGHAKSSVQEVETAVRSLFSEVKLGFERLRSQKS